MNLIPTRRFAKALARLGPEQTTRVQKSLAQFLQAPRHPSLHFEKLKGTEYRTIRVNLNFRVVMREVEGGMELVDVLDHHGTDTKYG